MHRKDHMKVVSPFNEDGQYEDWEVLESLWQYAFSERLRVDPHEYAVLLAEPSGNAPSAREKAVEVLFERFAPPAVFLARAAVLSSFATARQTSLVVDVGHQATTVAAVQDGYLLQRSVVRSPLGGALMTDCMRRAVEATGTPLRPRHLFRRVERAPGLLEVEAVEPGLTDPSFTSYAVDVLAGDIKEAVCRLVENTFMEETYQNMPTATYELPDGTEISLGSDRYKVPEIVFQPELVRTFPGMEHFYEGKDSKLLPLPGLVMESINHVDPDARRELYSGVVLTGGSSLFAGFRERLEREMAEVAPSQSKLKVICPTNAVERRYSVWVGGSILSSLGSFQQMWLSKAEFEEHGPSLIHRKAP